MRGKAFNYDRGRRFSGITPAYAGKSFCNFRWRCDAKDHPRLCGEKR